MDTKSCKNVLTVTLRWKIGLMVAYFYVLNKNSAVRAEPINIRT